MPAFSGIQCSLCTARVEIVEESPTDPDVPLGCVSRPLADVKGWLTLAPVTGMDCSHATVIQPMRRMLPREFLCPKHAECIPESVRSRLVAPQFGAYRLAGGLPID